MTSLAKAIARELPRLRRYAHGTVGSADLGDRCVAECLRRVVEDPRRLDPLGTRLGLYRLFHETTGNVEAAASPGAIATTDRRERLWRSLPLLPLGERQALMLVAVEGLSPEDAAEVLGLAPAAVRARVTHAERALLKRTAASVLIIENEVLLAADLSRIVTEMGHEVCGAASGRAEALAMAARWRPTLVLADVELGGGECGRATVEEIRRRIDTEVIYVTAHAPDGADGASVVGKPIHRDLLEAAMGAALARGRRRREGEGVGADS